MKTAGEPAPLNKPVNLARRRHLAGITAAGLMSWVHRGFGASSADRFPVPDDAGTIAVEGGRIWYRINGRRHFANGRAPLLVLHGGPGASHHYLLPLLDLADDRPVIFYDQLDSGNADRPGREENWTVQRFVGEIHAIRNALGLDRLFTLGSSCGATWCAEYAMDNPGGLLGSVLGSPFLSAKRWMADAKALRSALPENVRTTLSAHEAAGTTDSDAYHDADMVWNRRHVCRLDPFPDYVLAAFEQFNYDLYNHMWGPSESLVTGTLKDYEAEPRLGLIESPVLYTCGEHDEATPASTAAFTAATPGAVMQTFAHASHMPHAETRGLYVTALRAFFADNETA